MRKYAQSIAMLLASVVMAVFALYRELGVDGMTPSEWITVVIAVFTTITVWGAANVPGFEKAKTFVAAVGLVLNLAVSAIVGGVTTDEWLMLAVQFLGALGVAAVPKVVWTGKPIIDGAVVR
jgi:hypothetical protein